MNRHALPALLTAALLAGCSREKAPDTGPTEAPARSVSVGRVERRPLGGDVEASGLLVAREEAAVSAQVGGFRIAEVLVQEGDIVRAGQPLARLDPTLLAPRIAQARASVAQADADAAQARSDASRVAGLDNTGILSGEQIATRRFKAKSQDAAVDVARAQLRDLTVQQAQLVIRAPVAGVILERTAQPGAVASAGGDPLFRIARGGQIELDAEIPEGTLSSVRVGSSAHVILPSGLDFNGRVRLVSPRIDAKTKLGRARITLPVDPQLRAGGFARATFRLAQRDVPAVPEKAVQFEASGPVLVMVGKDGRAHRQAVRTGARDGGWVELVQGPAVGTPVALGGGAFLLDGDPVRAVTSSAADGN